MLKVRPFFLLRNEDETGISGKGIVAVGAILPSGTAIIEWSTFTSSIGIYKNLDHVVEVHGHQGKTVPIMGDEWCPAEAAKELEKPKKKRKSKAKKDEQKE